MGTFGLPLFAVLILLIFKSSDSTTHSSDIEALQQLYRNIDPKSIYSGSCVSSWNFSVDPCDSIFSQTFTCGFRCDATDTSGLSRITEISLDRAGYSGYFSLSGLPFLESVDVADNQFHGPIPSNLSSVTSLRRFCLSRNTFSGEIPASIGEINGLEELYLDNNQLQGEIPASFGNLKNLERIELQSNNLSGNLPDFSSCESLYFIDISDNRMWGTVGAFPESIVEISMRNNFFDEFPHRIGDLKYLQVMDLSNNNLSGTVPSELFSHPSLEQLTLSYNQLSSLQMPGNGASQNQLIALDLGYNALEGLLPAFMGLMPKLSALSLASNRFTGMIPSQYAIKAVVPTSGVSPFVRLILSGNYLFGPIPSPLMDMKPGSAVVSLVDNCLMRCPEAFFFCQGGEQKSLTDCRNFSPVIP